MKIVNTIKDWNYLNKGMKIRFKSPTMEHPEATYEGQIINRYSNYLLVKGSPIVSTMEENILCNPISYNFCIPRYLSNEEKFMVEEEDLHYAVKKAG